MKYPTLDTIETSRDMITEFKGYNHNLIIGENEFYDMKNMTSDDYPALSVRKKRGKITTADGIIPSPITNPKAIIARDYIAYIDGNNLVYNNEIVYSGLDGRPKQLVSIGTYLVVFPDKYYYNTKNPADSGSMIYSYEKNKGGGSTNLEDRIRIVLCNQDGEEYTYKYVDMLHFKDLTANVSNGEYAYSCNDDSVYVSVYSATKDLWIDIPNVYTKIKSEDIGIGLKKGDSIYLKSMSRPAPFDGKTPCIIYAVDKDYIVISGAYKCWDEQYKNKQPAVIEIIAWREIPIMDYVIESGNRLWGCRYGRKYGDNNIYDGNDFLNEIYACKLGDFKNWNCYAGISTDSYAVSLGSDGEFTGAATYNGYPVFFKENRIIKILGTQPSNYQTQEIVTMGVQKGSEKSIATIDGVLFYKSDKSICAYDGSMPTSVSKTLGDVHYKNAASGSIGKKYYISMQDDNDNWHMFVCDTEKGLWHREDDTHAIDFCTYNNDLYYIDYDNNMITVKGSKGKKEDVFDWYIESGIIGYSYPDNKYVSKFNIRMILPKGSKLSMYIKYNSFGAWEHKGTLQGKTLQSFTIPIIPRRCDHFKIRLEGIGDVKILSISKTLEIGSDII